MTVLPNAPWGVCWLRLTSRFLTWQSCRASSRTRSYAVVLVFQGHKLVRKVEIEKSTVLSWLLFLAATKQLYKWYFPSVRPSVCLSVRPSVRPSHLFDYVPIMVSSWNFQELLPMTEVTSMQKVKVRGQRSRSQRSQPNFTVSGL